MQSFLRHTLFWAMIASINGCQTDKTVHTMPKAHLLHETKSAMRHTTTTKTPKPNPTDERIRLLKAQTESRARLAQIEARKAEHLKKLETEQATTLARLESQKAQKIKELDAQTQQNTAQTRAQIAQTRAQTELAIEKERQHTALIRARESQGFYKQLALIIGIVGLLLVGLLYLLYRHRHALKLKLHEEELRHRSYLETSRQHHEQVTKMLEIIASDSTDKALRKELTKLLGSQRQSYDTVLLENKK